MNTNKMVVSRYPNMALISTKPGKFFTRTVSSLPDQQRDKKYRAYPEWAIRPGYLG